VIIISKELISKLRMKFIIYLRKKMMALLGEHITCDAVHKSVNDIRNTLSKL
jgi:hypothetical protein